MSKSMGTPKTLREAVRLGICIRPPVGAPIEDMIMRCTKDFLRQRFATAVLEAGLAREAGQVVDLEKRLMDLLKRIEEES